MAVNEEPYQDLMHEVKMDTEKHTMTFKRNFTNKLWPFFSRNPERYELKDNFDGALGVITRLSQGKQVYLTDNQIDKTSIREKITTKGIEDDELAHLFNLDSIRTNQIEYLKYLTTSTKSDKVGQAQTAMFVLNLLQIRNNDEWQALFGDDDSSDLFTKVVMQLLPNLADNTEEEKVFKFFHQERYLTQFKRDMQVLAQANNRTFVVKNIGLILAYFYLFYLIYEIPQTFMEREPSKPLKMYFNYEKEASAQSRQAIKSMEYLKNATKYLLQDNDLLDYLNLLMGHSADEYQSLAAILAGSETEKRALYQQLQLFNAQYAVTKEKNTSHENAQVDIDTVLINEINQLRGWLRADIDPAPITRFSKGFDALRNMNFIKSRGRLGSVLNVSQELLLALTAVIVGNNGKMLLKDVFAGFEAHGMYFDNLTKDAVAEFYIEINILDKMSDSGDAQYVKQIL